MGDTRPSYRFIAGSGYRSQFFFQSAGKRVTVEPSCRSPERALFQALGEPSRLAAVRRHVAGYDA